MLRKSIAFLFVLILAAPSLSLEYGSDEDIDNEENIYNIKQQVNLLKSELNKLILSIESLKLCDGQVPLRSDLRFSVDSAKETDETPSSFGLGKYAKAPTWRNNVIAVVVNALEQGEYDEALSHYHNIGNKSLSRIIPIVYNGNVENTEKVVKFLEILPNIHETLAGYRILFEAITKANDLDSLPIIMWKRQVESESGSYYYVDESPQTSNRNASAENFRHILAKSIIDVPWNLSIYIENAVGSRLSLLNGLFDTSSICEGRACAWQLIKREGTGPTAYQIYSRDEKQYIMIELTPGGAQRHIFTSADPNNDDRSYWTFVEVPGGEFFQIKNFKYAENYLIADGKETYTSTRCDGGNCLWKIVKV